MSNTGVLRWRHRLRASGMLAQHSHETCFDVHLIPKHFCTEREGRNVPSASSRLKSLQAARCNGDDNYLDPSGSMCWCHCTPRCADRTPAAACCRRRRHPLLPRTRPARAHLPLHSSPPQLCASGAAAAATSAAGGSCSSRAPATWSPVPTTPPGSRGSTSNRRCHSLSAASAPAARTERRGPPRPPRPPSSSMCPPRLPPAQAAKPGGHLPTRWPPSASLL